MRYVFVAGAESRTRRATAASRRRGDATCFSATTTSTCRRDWVARARGGASRAAASASSTARFSTFRRTTHRPKPRPRTIRARFFARATRRFRSEAFERAGGFDESFDLYGWEDTELGVRLRGVGVRWKFAWDAYLWHVKPPDENTLAVESRKAVEKARMARQFLDEASVAAGALGDRRASAEPPARAYLLARPASGALWRLPATQRAPPWLSAVDARTISRRALRARARSRARRSRWAMSRALLYCAGGGIGDSLVASVVGTRASTSDLRRSTRSRCRRIAIARTSPRSRRRARRRRADERALARGSHARVYEAVS